MPVPSSRVSLHVVAFPRPVVLVRRPDRLQQDQPENYSKLKTGMSKAEVEQLLGTPAECSGALGMSSCTGDEKSFISVQYAADKVLIYSGQGLK